MKLSYLVQIPEEKRFRKVKMEGDKIVPSRTKLNSICFKILELKTIKSLKNNHDLIQLIENYGFGVNATHVLLPEEFLNENLNKKNLTVLYLKQHEY